MNCPNVDGPTNAQVPDKIDSNTIKFTGHWKLTTCGYSGGPMLTPDDPDIIDKGGCYVKKITVTTKSQVQNNSGGWNDVKTTSSSETGGVDHTEAHTISFGGDVDTYRCRAKTVVEYCDGSTEQFPHGGGWDTSDTRRF